MTTNNPTGRSAPLISSTAGGDSRLPKGATGSPTNQASIPSQNSLKGPHPSLRAIARLLGRQAGQFFAENRLRGLGGVELYRLQREAQQMQKLINGEPPLSDTESWNEDRKNSTKTAD